jgi:hypothetical protein
MAAAVAGSMLTGGLMGAALVAANTAASAATTASPSPGAAGIAAPSGTFKPNEDTTHEAGESAAREAQENAGQMPTVP